MIKKNKSNHNAKPKEKELPSGVVCITQDAGAYVFYDETPAHIQGIYTDKIETCLVFVVFGKRGFCVIHDTDRLSIIEMEKAFRVVGEIEDWTFIYNPKTYPFPRNDPGFWQKGNRGMVAIEAIAFNSHRREPNGNIRLYTAPEGFVTIARGKYIDAQTQPSSQIEPLDFTVRKQIIDINNLFSETDELAVDIQFDGHNLTPCIRLNQSRKEIARIAELPKYKEYSALTQQFQAMHHLISLTPYGVLDEVNLTDSAAEVNTNIQQDTASSTTESPLEQVINLFIKKWDIVHYESELRSKEMLIYIDPDGTKNEFIHQRFITFSITNLQSKLVKEGGVFANHITIPSDQVQTVIIKLEALEDIKNPKNAGKRELISLLRKKFSMFSNDFQGSCKISETNGQITIDIPYQGVEKHKSQSINERFVNTLIGSDISSFKKLSPESYVYFPSQSTTVSFSSEDLTKIIEKLGKLEDISKIEIDNTISKSNFSFKK